MKFPLLSLLAAGAAIVQVSASPLRVVAFGSDGPKAIRYGHGVPNNGNKNPNIAMVLRPDTEIKARGPCRGARMRAKAIEFSNSVRKALGLPLIEPSTITLISAPNHGTEQSGRVHILPFIGTPNTFVEPGKFDANPPYLAHPHRPYHNHEGFRQRLRNSPFIERLHIALMALGPWEGRAVAFVLGCGIGVLLRMMWVLAIVSYRLVKGQREEEPRYTEILVVEEYNDVEEAAPAPPTYTFADDKGDKKVETAEAK